ncbi:MAG TPA: LLM class flavin-dependent oxidoreductase [Candidatus Limnocylindrales bacterium]|nr:LLM class flavin-dependent oxidoreductase [Candidatus Limnocylindrales bacterium]
MTVAATPAVWTGLDHLRPDEALAFVRELESLGFGAFWTREGVGREPFALLSAAATATSTIRLGTAIANVYARDPMTARAAGSTLQELSDGRFMLGLGVSHPGSVEKIRGHTYGPPREVMGRYLQALAAADYKGPAPAVPVPVLIAALGDRMLRLAGSQTDGAIPYLFTVEALAAARATIDAAASDAGRARPRVVLMVPVVPLEDRAAAMAAARTALGTYSSLPAYRRSYLRQGFEESDFDAPGGPSERLLDAIVASGSRADIVARLGELASAGADELAIVPIGGDGVIGSLDAVRRLAPPW